jgi:hypothetical protein
MDKPAVGIALSIFVLRVLVIKKNKHSNQGSVPSTPKYAAPALSARVVFPPVPNLKDPLERLRDLEANLISVITQISISHHNKKE